MSFDPPDKKLLARWKHLEADHLRTEAVSREMDTIAASQFGPLLAENDLLRQRIADRRTIEKAKGILMHAYGWTEAIAYRRLQAKAMLIRVPMVELATAIIEGKRVDL